MTESEAKKWINTLKNWNSILPEAQEACEIAEKLFEELKALKENERKCKDCAGCTNWKCDCANVRAQAIDEFADKMIIMMPGHRPDIEQIAEQMKGGAV